MPSPVPPGDLPRRPRARLGARIGFALVGTGLVAGGIALAELSLLLLPVTLAAGWLGTEALIAGVVGRRVRGLLLIRLG